MTWKRHVHVLGALGVALAAAAGSSAQELSARLSAAKSAFSGQDDVAFSLTLTNTGRADAYVLHWETPIRGVQDDIFVVQRNGEDVRYVGRLYRRLAPRAKDFVRLAPGASLTSEFELSAHYDMLAAGEYSVSYRVPEARLSPGAALAERAAHDDDAPQVQSNTVSVWVDGLDEAMAQALRQSRLELYESEGSGDQGLAAAPRFRNCSSSRRSATTTALRGAETYADEAAAFLNASASSSARYVRWFGTFSSSRFNTVRANFNDISDTLGGATFTFDCGCNEPDTYAYVYPDRPYYVWLCGAFWPAPQNGTNSKAGTIVHEASHFYNVAGTDDLAYGTSACRNLARTSPSRAIRNADNYTYFCEVR